MCTHVCIDTVPFCIPWFPLKAQIVGSKRPFSCLNCVVLGVSIDCMPDSDKEILFFFQSSSVLAFFSARPLPLNEWNFRATSHRLVFSPHKWHIRMAFVRIVFDSNGVVTWETLENYGMLSSILIRSDAINKYFRLMKSFNHLMIFLRSLSFQCDKIYFLIVGPCQRVISNDIFIIADPWHVGDDEGTVWHPQSMFSFILFCWNRTIILSFVSKCFECQYGTQFS